MRVSILGDSISTFPGFIPDYHECFYLPERAEQSGVARVEDTWWYQVLSHFDWQLATNNAWSGSLCSGNLDSAGTNPERIAYLHAQGAPDVLISYFGINDYGENVAVEDQFQPAFEQMLAQLHEAMPQTRCYICTLADAQVPGKPQLQLSERFEANLPAYSAAIRAAVANAHDRGQDVVLLDLAQAGLIYESYDGTHPTKQGMSQLAQAVIASIEASNQ